MAETANLEREVKDLKRRVDLAETRLSQIEGQFGFISGQLKDIQLYLHARFSEVGDRLYKIEGKVDAIPRAVAEMIRELRQ